MRRSAAPLLLLVAGLAAGCVTGPRAVDPLSAEEHNDLGVAYFARGEVRLALREFERSLALRPGFTRARVNLGDARLALGQVDGAIGAYEQARAASPEDPAIANNLAWALLQHERRWPEAEPVIREALATEPEPRGYFLDTLGMLLLRQDAPREALDAFRGALADPGLRDRAVRALVLRHAGEAWRRLGEPAAAERCDRLAAGLAGPATPGAAAAKVGGGDTVC